MTRNEYAAHILSGQHPELASDDVSRYVAFLKDKLGPSKASAVYSVACRSAPVGENPMGLRRGSVVDIQGRRYVVLGCGFMTLEFASLESESELRTMRADEFAHMGEDEFKVFDAESSRRIIDEMVGGAAK